MPSFSIRFAVAVFALPLGSATPLLEERAIDCSKPAVKSFAAIAKEKAGLFVLPFCSSYLNICRTKTVTETFTYYIDAYTTVTSGTYTDYSITTKFIPETTTITYRAPVYKGGLLKRDAAPAPAPAAATQLKAAANSAVLGFASGVVSAACSCLVTGTPGPTETTFRVIEQTVTATDVIPTKTVKRTYTDTFTDTRTKSIIQTPTYIVPATCADAKPTFYAQLQDTDPARSDRFNKHYLYAILAVDPTRQNWLDTDADVKKSLLFTFDAATGYVQEWPNGFYAAVSPYSRLEQIVVSSKQFIDAYGYFYMQCKLDGTAATTEWLDCVVTTGAWPLTELQTCPVYEQMLGTPLALGEELHTRAPECYRKRIRIYRACTPRA